MSSALDIVFLGLSITSSWGNGHATTYRALAKADPEAIKHYGVINSTYQSIKDAGNRAKAAAQVLGYSVVSYQEVPLLVDNWRPFVENLKSAGVQVFELVRQSKSVCDWAANGQHSRNKTVPRIVPMALPRKMNR